MGHNYLTIAHPGSGIFKAKGSKHIGYARQASNEQEAQEFPDELRKRHNRAEHVCYAWRLGADKERVRTNDDGEPANSAGAPILGQIEKYDLTDTVVAVVRYFGGVKLGVGGLIEAYRTAAMMAIEDAGIIRKQLLSHYRLHFGYDRMSEVMTMLRMNGWEDSHQDFTTSCKLVVSVMPDKTDEFHRAFQPFNDIRIENLGIS